MHKYLPHTNLDIKEMLTKSGLKSLDDLAKHIPNHLIFKDEYNVPLSLSDLELSKELEKLSLLNSNLTIFRGYGNYDVYTPAHINALINRQEFLTSYTPYQPEVSQGTLQYIFEYQSMICELTNMDVTNASMYDGPTATAEAMFMAINQTRKNKIVYSKTINPRTIDIIKTYGKYRDVEFVELPEVNGVSDLSKLSTLLEGSSGVIFQNPNHYGHIEDLSGISDLVHQNGGLLIINQDPQSLARLKTPGELGADIAVGGLQSLGMPLSFGGAHAGYLATTKKLMRKMPGRICGVTTDLDGKRAFVLTLQAREQHIRREKANSNICSNQSLMALVAAIYMASVGKHGFKQVFDLSLSAANYLKNELIKTNKFEDVFSKPFYNEFTLKYIGDANKLDNHLIENGFLGPVVHDNGLVTFAVTEKRSKQEIDDFVRLVGAF